MTPSDFLNWATVSRYLCGGRTSLTRGKKNLKHQPEIDILIKHIELALIEIEKLKSTK